MDLGLHIILLNGKYKMFGMSKALLQALDNSELIMIHYDRAQQLLLFNKGTERNKCFSYKDAEETKDYFWVPSEYFVTHLENELFILRNYVAICFQGQVREFENYGKCVAVDTSNRSYVSLGFDNMPPTIEQHYPKLNHLYNKTFQI